MKNVLSALLVLSLVTAVFPQQLATAQESSELSWLGRVSALGGAEREAKSHFGSSGAGPHGLGAIELLGVLPVWQNFGAQVHANYVGGQGSRFNLDVGPLFAWSGGKAGFFVANQWRNYPDGSQSCIGDREMYFTWLRPALALYFPNINVDMWLNQTINRGSVENSIFCDRRKVYAPQSEFRAMVNYFPPIPVFGPGNLELSLGIGINNFTGPTNDNLTSGVGPAFGVALMPWRNLEVTLIKAVFDNRNRYQVATGLQYYFHSDKAATTLLQLRRKYLEPTNLPGRVSTFWNRTD